MDPETPDVTEVLRRNAVKRSGVAGARPLVFGHGFGTSQHMWRFVAAEFEAQHEVVLFDHVGSGNSDASAYDRARYDSLHGYASDLNELLEAMDLRDVVFVGHSVSGMIGVLAAIERPERFGALVLVGGSPRYVNDGDYVGGFELADVQGLLDAIDSNFVSWADQMAPILISEEEQPELSAELAESFKDTDPRIARHFARVTYLSDHRASLPKVAVPTLVVQSVDDGVAPLVVGEYLRDHIPNARLSVLSAGGHYAHLVNPSELAVRIRESLG